MADLSDYPNLIQNTDQSRCGTCNAFVDGSECHRSGPIQKCHCGEFRPVKTTREGFDGTMYFMLECPCNGVTESWVWETEEIQA